MNIRLLFAPIALSLSAWGQTYLIYTVAGNGTQGYAGDGSAATSAQLALPSAVAFDSAGNMYIADAANNVVRKVSNGTITTFAGTNTAGFSGDKGPATKAQLNNPCGVAVDSSGNVYIADSNNHVVRMVSTSGTITTFAGTGTVPGFQGDTGPANQAELNVPLALAVDSNNNLYIADSNNNDIRVVTAGTINSVATATSYLSHPDGVAVDKAGNIYVADTGNQRVVKFAASSSAFSLIAGTGVPGFSGDDGPAQKAELLDPKGVAVDAAGYIYIADTFNSRVRKVGLDGSITTIAGTGYPSYGGQGQVATTAPMYFPNAVAVDQTGNVYIADTHNSTIRMLQVLTPAIQTGGVVNSATFAAEISQGALATIVGANLSSGKATAKAPYPLSLGDVSVTVNGIPAPILYIQPTLVNFQVPWEVQPGQGTVVVSVNGVSAPPMNVKIGAAAPGIFLIGGGGPAIVNADGTINSASNPAKAGSLVSVYLTGSGPVSPGVADGVPAGANPLSVLTGSYSATIGQTSPTIQYAGLAPGAVGLVQFNLIVPSGLQPTTYPLTITINGESSNSVPVAVMP
jgi:uncharacterized protein (TIGR03437 family)